MTELPPQDLFLATIVLGSVGLLGVVLHKSKNLMLSIVAFCFMVLFGFILMTLFIGGLDGV